MDVKKIIQGRKVLIVDDEKDILEILMNLLDGLNRFAVADIPTIFYPPNTNR